MKNLLQKTAKEFGFGLGLWRMYTRPRNFLAEYQREGAANILLKRFGAQQMASAAWQLTPMMQTEKDNHPKLETHFLTGRKFWYQTLFCAYSMMQRSDAVIRPIFYDDGTLDRPLANHLRHVLPGSTIVTYKEIEQRLNDHLPEHNFPTLRRVRLEYPHLRKLTDIHVGRDGGWKLVLDSDMLFFQKPKFLLQWLTTPNQPCYMTDVRTAYGYSPKLMSQLAKGELPERVNVGICGLQSSQIDWDELEFWCNSLIEKEGLHFFLEQALSGMLLTNRQCAVAPHEEYLVYPSREEVTEPRALMHHYTGESKAWYFRFGWRHIFHPTKRNDSAALEKVGSTV